MVRIEKIHLCQHIFLIVWHLFAPNRVRLSRLLYNLEFKTMSLRQHTDFNYTEILRKGIWTYIYLWIEEQFVICNLTSGCYQNLTVTPPPPPHKDKYQDISHSDICKTIHVPAAQKGLNVSFKSNLKFVVKFSSNNHSHGHRYQWKIITSLIPYL